VQDQCGVCVIINVWVFLSPRRKNERVPLRLCNTCVRVGFTPPELLVPWNTSTLIGAEVRGTLFVGMYGSSADIKLQDIIH